MDVSARIVTLELAETFVISRSARDSEDVVVVELRHSGVSGFGEAQPVDRYEESAESARAYVEEHVELLGDDPFALEEVMERLPAREFAARAAVDAALHDLQGKLLGQPVWRLLGLRRAGPPTSWTIWLGDPDDMARRAEKALDRFRRLKLKLGGRDGLDVERVRAVRGVAGDLPLQVDVNEAWSLEEALECAACAGRARRRLLRAAAARRRPRGARAEGALAHSDLRRRGLPYARGRRRRARSVPTGSTSSSPSRAGSARRCGWCTPPARSASAACSAA